jgi:hypothetical protein
MVLGSPLSPLLQLLGIVVKWLLWRCRLATLVIMTNTPAGTGNGNGFEVVVGSDGALTVPAAELARRGVRPGAHLRLVPEEQLTGERKRMAGALAGSVPAEAVEELLQGLEQAKAERVAYYSGTAEQA